MFNRRKKGTPQGNLIRLLLYAAGSSPSAVARVENVSVAAVSQVMHGRRMSARIQRRIELITKRPWPRTWAA